MTSAPSQTLSLIDELGATGVRAATTPETALLELAVVGLRHALVRAEARVSCQFVHCVIVSRVCGIGEATDSRGQM